MSDFTCDWPETDCNCTPPYYGCRYPWRYSSPEQVLKAADHRQADELGHESDGRLFHEAICRRCGLMLAYNVRDQVECVRR